MRWKTPSERTQMVLLSPILIPAAIVLVAAFGVMAVVLWPFDWWQCRQIRKGWHSWFAWHPVRLSGFFYDRPDRWVWLETIERRKTWGGADYRFTGEA